MVSASVCLILFYVLNHADNTTDFTIINQGFMQRAVKRRYFFSSNI